MPWRMLPGWIIAVVAIVSMPYALEGQIIVAHRGASEAAPENTLAAFREAWQQGADAIEGDFALTKDGEIVCIHDRDTQRTTGHKLIVAESTLAELRELDAGSWKHSRFARERIPTLDEVLDLVPPERTIFIEIKCGPEIAETLSQVVSRSKLSPSQIRIISFNSEVIAAVKKLRPDLKAFWLTSFKRDKKTGHWQPTIEQILATLERVHADGLDCRAHEVVDHGFVQKLRGRSHEFHAWTVDEGPTARRLCRLGVDSITTNIPARLRLEIPGSDLRSRLQLALFLDGDLRDASGHGHDGSALGESVAYAPGISGRALDLRSGKTAVAVEHRLPDTGSVTLWYHTQPWYDYQTIFDNEAHENHWEMWIYRDGRLRFRDQPGGAIVTHSLHPVADLNEWHHIALTWAREDTTRHAVKLFVDGNPVANDGWGRDGFASPGKLFYLGGGLNSKGRGRWDEVAIFDRVLTQGEVRFIMRYELEALQSQSTPPSK